MAIKKIINDQKPVEIAPIKTKNNPGLKNNFLTM